MRSICPACRSSIDSLSTRCPYCTSYLVRRRIPIVGDLAGLIGGVIAIARSLIPAILIGGLSAAVTGVELIGYVVAYTTMIVSVLIAAIVGYLVGSTQFRER